MTALVGAWSLTGDPIDQHLPAAVRGQLRAALPGAAAGAASGALRELAAGRLWLCAHADKLVEARAATVAGEGFFAAPGLAQALTPGVTPEGHFALVRHDQAGGTVTLFRSLSGGERLYVARAAPGVVVFAATVWPLLILVGARLAPGAAGDTLLTGLTMFGTETLHQGVSEILPGHELVLGREVGDQRFRCPEILAAPAGDPEALARDFRARLTEAVVAGAGPARPVLVALSGGIDSSAVAAAAVDAFGAGAVHALTYEFNDAEHSTELHYAKQVTERLGIRHHHVFKLDVDRYLAAIPEMIYRSESLVHWPKAFMLMVAREVARLGHDRYLTGFGIGSHLAYLAELGRRLAVIPGALLRRAWPAARFSSRAWPHALERLHPALEPPHPRIYYLLVRLLAARGLIGDVTRFFPDQLTPLIALGRHFDGDGERGDCGGLAGDMHLPLGPWLQRRAFARGVACIDVTRSEKASRELGVYRVSPAHFDRCVPYAHFPIEPSPRLYSAARNLRPGKHLLRIAYRHTLPDEVLYRVKSWGDAVASDTWVRMGRRMILSVLPRFPHDFADHGVGCTGAIASWESQSILATSLALRLWIRLFIELPRADAPPTWGSLWHSLAQLRRCA